MRLARRSAAAITSAAACLHIRTTGQVHRASSHAPEGSSTSVTLVS